MLLVELQGIQQGQGGTGRWNRRVEPTAPVPATGATPDGCSAFLAIAGIVVFVGVNGDRAGGTDQIRP